MFIGRVKELEELMRCYRREGFCLFELYDPRSHLFPWGAYEAWEDDFA